MPFDPVCDFCFWSTFTLADDAATARDFPAEDPSQQQLLDAGAQLLAAGKPAESITQYFDKVITSYEKIYAASAVRFYSARGQAESLVYLLEAAKDNTSARVLKSTWSYAYYLKAYALIELRRDAEARPLLEKALRLSPHNAQFLTELGNAYQREKNWAKALETDRLAETAAREFTSEEARNLEVGRALRGQAYTLVELGRLAEAESVYLKCLEIDRKDKKAVDELQYVRSLKPQQPAR